jgi:hypothetical protein
MAWGMGHGAWGMGHGAWRMAHGAWRVGQWAMGHHGMGKINSNAQCPMPNAQCPMPNAQCPYPQLTVYCYIMSVGAEALRASPVIVSGQLRGD